MALGEMDRPQWLYAKLDLDLVVRVRGVGEVFNFNDWAEQNGAEVPPAELIDLR